MPSDTLPELSPEQNFAHKLAAQELAKYCQEFSRWRKTKRGRAAVDNTFAVRRTLEVASMQEPEQPSSPTPA
jgi:GH24 family phage-related lysozyme (muramidase)